MYGAGTSVQINQDFLSTDFVQNPSSGNRSMFGGQIDEGKEERTQGRSVGRMDEWGRKADRKIDTMKLTLIFLNIANASKM
jgi:hypothetical protein